MFDYTDILQKCALFDGIDRGDLRSMLGCLDGRVRDFDRGEAVFSEGGAAEALGIVLSGAVQIVMVDFYGNRTIQSRVEPGELFGEAFACAGVKRLPVTVEGVSPGKVMLIPIRRVTETCQNACAFHNQMVMNLLKAMAAKNLLLNRKLQITSHRTTREKLMAYLMAQARQADSDSFTIPFDRQALADYLCVERSALSAEISRLRKDGILLSDKSRFTLLKQEGSL